MPSPRPVTRICSGTFPFRLRRDARGPVATCVPWSLRSMWSWRSTTCWSRSKNYDGPGSRPRSWSTGATVEAPRRQTRRQSRSRWCNEIRGSVGDRVGDGTAVAGHGAQIVGISSARYHAWRRKEEGCGLDDQPSCPKFFPRQLTREEVSTMRDFAKAAQRAKLKGVTLHTCRIRFVRLAARGADLVTVQALAGHATIVTTMRYAHDVAAREAISLLEQGCTEVAHTRHTVLKFNKTRKVSAS